MTPLSLSASAMILSISFKLAVTGFIARSLLFSLSTLALDSRAKALIEPSNFSSYAPSPSSNLMRVVLAAS